MKVVPGASYQGLTFNKADIWLLGVRKDGKLVTISSRMDFEDTKSDSELAV